MKYLVLVLLGLGLNSHADEAKLKMNECKTTSEKRALLFNKEICALEATCMRMGFESGPVEVKENAYCRPDMSNSCPTASVCMEDKSITKADIPMIIPKFGGDNVAPIKSTGDAAKTCACEADKSKRTDGSKRADGPAKTGADGAVIKRTESTSGRGVN
ncbi:hypothetical protein [Bdellovibrio svalbardensis]|uniref:Uncharacterized protein n=1 Tax=Bdellovibrio svalbardensis TaxID=2972972 RepID=A0ABT6DFB9_9BACT|nr:hypothetical protein [Bdellovibrio svalbardensis]MDG0815526.1 hypothetical protein [Bdellovibrio svalbardensis]